MRERTYLPALEDILLSMGGEGISPLEDELYGNPMIPWDQGVDVAAFGGLRPLGSKRFQRGNVNGITKRDITVMNPRRGAYPGVYGRPDEIAAGQARIENIMPEDPMFEQLWGVNRNELYEMNVGRVGNEAPNIAMPANPKRSTKAALEVMGPRNTQRILDTLEEAGKYPDLHRGMDSWYEMGPLWDRMQEISPDPQRDFERFQTFTGLASPGSDVLSEINRGTAALFMDNMGRLDEFLKYGRKSNLKGAPEDLAGLSGHPYHKTAQGPSMQKYSELGDPSQKSPKVPLYIQSAGTEATGFQNQLPVGDAHFSRAVGLADTRGAKEFGGSITTPELLTMEDWWRNNIAGELGISPVNAQGRMWGTFAAHTGVDSPVGASKLELITRKIQDAALEYGISPEVARDQLLLGNIFAPNRNLIR